VQAIVKNMQAINAKGIIEITKSRYTKFIILFLIL